jgi:alkylhydroperoxidase family enzyme
MQSRMTQPVLVLPDAMKALQAFGKVADDTDVPAPTLALVHLRASQINGCSVCTAM